MTTVVNFGAGKNSSAMIIAMWLKKEPIDAIVFADTGNEKLETYQFIEKFDNWLTSVGLPNITIVRHRIKKRNKRFCLYPAITTAKNLTYWLVHNYCSAYADYLVQNYHYENLGEQMIISHLFPSVAYGNGACAGQWKLAPISKWRQDKYPDKGTVCIGYHAGEKRRLFNKKGELRPNQDEDGWERRYPLIEWGLTEADCQNLLDSVLGYIPPKSSCWFCPNSRPYEVIKLPKELQELGSDIEGLAAYQGKIRGVASPLTALGRTFKWSEIDKLPEYKLTEPPKPCTCMDLGYEQLELFGDENTDI